ncbi:MAG: hypothetical protein SGI92_30170 [Bryobacteraceae bacterium]|nr:hypothetical protein [Bryobacteraceae bacterium]
MTDQQLDIAVGLPMVAVLVGVLFNAVWWIQSNSRAQAMENRLDLKIDRVDSRLERFEARMDSRFDRLESAIVSKMDLLTGKVIEIDNRLTRVEEQLKHLR